MENCIFCKIANKEIPSYKLYEDEDIIAFLDIAQATKGHALVICKKHYQDLLSVPSDLLSNMVIVAQRIAKQQMSKLNNIKGINILNNCGEVAGQVIQHFHIHVIPRYEKKDYLIEPNSSNSLSPQEFNQIVDDLKIKD